MKPPILTKTISLLIAILTLALLGCLTTIASAHPLLAHHHLATRERVPFWNDPKWGTKAPEIPQQMATLMPTRPIPSPFLTTTPSVAPPKPSSGVAAPTPAIAPLKPAASKITPLPTPSVAPPKPVSSTPAKDEKSCLDLSLWATASGPSPMMSVAGSLSKNKEPICSIWALVDQSSEKPVDLSCMKGHEASFRFDNGAGRYKDDGQHVNFNVVRGEEAKIDGKEAWSWRIRECWDE